MSKGPILHVAPALWSGAGNVITRLCEEHRRAGPVVLVTSGLDGALADWPAYRRRLRRAGVRHHTIDFYHREGDRFWTGAARLAELLREVNPSIVHAHAGVPCCGAVTARAMTGSRARIIGQMYSWAPGRPEWMNRQDAWGFSQADRVVCSAHAYSDLLVRYGVPARKLTYLPWGLPLGELPWRGSAGGPPHRKDAKASAGPLIGFVGRIEPRKGQLALVEAFARVRCRHHDARLELVGPIADPAYAARIRSAIRRHRLDDAVILAGRVRDVPRVIRRWDLFVSLSSDEGQGLAIMEAMAIGVPVAACPVAGVADFLDDDRTGLAIETRRAAAAVIGRFLARPDRGAAIAARARRMIERRYSWDGTIAALARLYGS